MTRILPLAVAASLLSSCGSEGDVGPKMHRVTFSVDHGTASGSNCDATVSGGNGVVQQTVRLLPRGSQTCTSLQLTAGSVTTRTCGEPIVCVETTIAQTMADVPSGLWTLEIHGLRGSPGPSAVVCYIETLDFAVADADGDVNLGTLLVPFDDSLNPVACNAT